jgi:hypothetical protein
VLRRFRCCSSGVVSSGVAGQGVCGFQQAFNGSRRCGSGVAVQAFAVQALWFRRCRSGVTVDIGFRFRVGGKSQTKMNSDQSIRHIGDKRRLWSPIFQLPAVVQSGNRKSYR